MKKIQKNAARFDNLKQDFLDDKKYSGTGEATLNGYRYDITRFLKFLSDEQLRKEQLRKQVSSCGHKAPRTALVGECLPQTLL